MQEKLGKVYVKKILVHRKTNLPEQFLFSLVQRFFHLLKKKKLKTEIKEQEKISQDNISTDRGLKSWAIKTN